MMRHSYVLLAAGLLAIFSGRAAAWCNMDEYNRNDPPSPISDVNDGYADLNLEWGSDVDLYQNGERAWDYVQNHHEQGVSVSWPKTGILIPFGNALPMGKVHCQKHYAPTKGSFVRDDDAPMRINSYPSSPAAAYVHSPALSDIQKEYTTIETGYLHEGKEVPVFVEISFFYYPDQRYAKMEVSYDPPEIGVVVSNTLFDLGEKAVAKLAGGAEYRTGQLQALVKMDDVSSKLFSAELNDASFMLRGGGKHLIGFESYNRPAAAIPVKLVDPKGMLIAAGQVFFDGKFGIQK